MWVGGHSGWRDSRSLGDKKFLSRGGREGEGIVKNKFNFFKKKLIFRGWGWREEWVWGQVRGGDDFKFF